MLPKKYEFLEGLLFFVLIILTIGLAMLAGMVLTTG